MKAVVHRVSSASVDVNDQCIGRIERGGLVLLGVARGDSLDDARWMAKKIVSLRIFDDEEKKMNYSLQEVRGALLAVSQFTLFADTNKGRRPSFVSAAPPEAASIVYSCFLETVEALGVTTARGEFQAHMQVCLVNDGPVTILLDTKK